MAKSIFSHHFPAAMMLILISVVSLDPTDAQTGACYGTLGNNLPPATEVVALCKAHNIRRIRLYNPNPPVLDALRGSNIAVTVGVANEDIIGISQNPNLAKSWVQNNVLKYPNVDFRYIAVGNEISPDGGGAPIASSLALAMQNMYNALSSAGLGQKVMVSTSLSMAVLGSSYPPSQGTFKNPSFMNPIVAFLSKTRSPLLINVYPYFSYVSDPTYIRLDYAIFTSTAPVVKDGPYQYQNLFSAMVDAFHAALEKAGGSDVEVVVSETGWPSSGGTATTIENARTYNTNLLKMVKTGTPRKPGKPVEAYVFDLFDEDGKSPELEKHWGIFLPNKYPKYPISFD